MAPFIGASLAQGEAAAHTTYQTDLRNWLPAGSGAVPDRRDLSAARSAPVQAGQPRSITRLRALSVRGLSRGAVRSCRRRGDEGAASVWTTIHQWPGRQCSLYRAWRGDYAAKGAHVTELTAN